MAELLAYQRDASWFNRPDHSDRRPKRWHLSNDGGHTPACGGTTFLIEDSPWDAAQVPEILRCKRNGCRQHWPSND